MKFNENIRNLRRERDYSQEYLAEKLNVTRQTISKWENGAAMPDLKKLTEIADFFSVSMDTLLGIEIENDDKEKSLRLIIMKIIIIQNIRSVIPSSFFPLRIRISMSRI